MERRVLRWESFEKWGRSAQDQTPLTTPNFDHVLRPKAYFLLFILREGQARLLHLNCGGVEIPAAHMEQFLVKT